MGLSSILDSFYESAFEELESRKFMKKRPQKFSHFPYSIFLQPIRLSICLSIAMYARTYKKHSRVRERGGLSF